jgi:hypothetical protein
MQHRRPILVGAIGLLAIFVALPVLAAQPEKSAKAKEDKAPITLKGSIKAAVDADGATSYTLTSAGTTYTLEAGPKWFFGDNHPLKPFVGKSVTIEGQVAAGSTEVDVTSVNGAALREPGKPPWAGGWKRVGHLHPGWSQAKADRFKAKFGDCFPPGQCKDKPAKGGPEASQAP